MLVAVALAARSGPAQGQPRIGTDGGTAISPPPPPPPPSPEALLRQRLSATFVPAPGVANQRAIDAGIDRAVGALFFMIRPIASSKIHSGNPLFSYVTLSFRPGEILVVSPPVIARSRDDGAAGSMRGLDGEPNQVTQRLLPDALLQTTWNASGRRVTRFVPSPDGTRLTMHVEITAPQLPIPVRYTLQYVRR